MVTVPPWLIVELEPDVAARVKREPPETKHVEQEISPSADKAIGLVADTATVPEALGKVIVLSETVGSVIAKIVSKASALAPSKVKGEAPWIVPVTVTKSASASPRVAEPFTVRSVVAVKEVVVVSEPGVVIAEGRVSTTAPVVGEAVIWLAVPVTDETDPVEHEPHDGVEPLLVKHCPLVPDIAIAESVVVPDA